MNVLLIIFKEIKHNLRNFKSNMMMVLFPIVLIIILGAAFSGVFDNTIDLGEISVMYTIDKDVEDPIFVSAFSNFRHEMSEETGIKFIESNDFKNAMLEVEDNYHAAFLHITGNPIRIDMYENASRTITSDIVENALNSFLDSYATMSVIARNNPAVLSVIDSSGSGDYVQANSLDRQRQPGSTDYYAITMLTLILLYACLTGFWGVRGEIEQKTAGRILCAPTTNYQLLAGKVFGSIIVTILQGLVVVVFSGLVLKAYWGEDMLTVAILIISYSIMAVSIGVGLAFLFKNTEAASGIMNTIIPILVFLGGGYVPLSEMDGIISDISSISPVKWINSALFSVIYDGNYSNVAVSIGVNLGLSVLFISISAVFSRRGNRVYA
jgi:ABC-2 type transport system permease protein